MFLEPVRNHRRVIFHQQVHLLGLFVTTGAASEDLRGTFGLGKWFAPPGRESVLFRGPYGAGRCCQVTDPVDLVLYPRSFG